MPVSSRLFLLAMLLGCSPAPPMTLMFDASLGEGGNGIIACNPGVVAMCVCPGNARGIRVCQEDETYTPCMCVDARVPCFVGAVQGCDCGNNTAGIQFCGEDGIFTGCMCPTAPRDAGDTADIEDAPLEDSPPSLDGGGARDASSDAAAQDASPDAPDVCSCASGTMRFCPLPAGQVEATYTHGRCRRGIQRCLDEACWSDCIGQVNPAPETCNGVDDNCNGLVDDIVVSCGLGPCRRVVNTCVDGGTVTCMPDLTMRSAETCNGVDDNCNGIIDDGCRDF